MNLTRPQVEILIHEANRYLLMKGQGGGKTFDMGIISGKLIEGCPKSMGMIAANTYGQLSDSTLKEVFSVWEKVFGWTMWSAKNPGGVYVFNKQPPDNFKPCGHTFTSNNNKVFFRSGTVVMLASLDNYEAIEGRTIGWALLDETADTTAEAVKEVITGRLREPTVFLRKDHEPKSGQFPYTGDPESGLNFNPLYVFTKPAKEKWLADFFDLEKDKEKIIGDVLDWERGNYYFRKENGRVVVIASALHNAPNLPANYFKQRMDELPTERVNFLIHAVPFERQGDEYASEFNSLKHVRPSFFTDGMPLHLSVDFNAKPYMTGLIMQMGANEVTGKQFCHVLGEYALKSPKNSAGALMGEFMRQWGYLCDFGLFLYGDSSGNNKMPFMEAKTLFNELEKHIEVNVAYDKRIPNQNPLYEGILGKGSMYRRDFLNALLKGNLGVDITIDPSCKELIADLTYCKEDANGRLLKKKNKEGIEERGHHVDALQYFLCHPKTFGYLAKQR